MFTKLSQKLYSFIEMGVPGYDCVIYHKGECVYRKYNGYSDRENKIPMNGKELYNIYSCSKVITCTAALQLYERGMFNLDDKLSKYMPEFETMYVQTDEGLKKAEKDITIKDLFCMSAGFSYNLYFLNRVKDGNIVFAMMYLLRWSRFSQECVLENMLNPIYLNR